MNVRLSRGMERSARQVAFKSPYLDAMLPFSKCGGRWGLLRNDDDGGDSPVLMRRDESVDG